MTIASGQIASDVNFGNITMVSFKYRNIAPLGAGDAKMAADFNGDGFTDIAVGAQGILAWYRYPTWTETVIATSNAQFTLDGQTRTADVNGDGRPDIVGSIVNSAGHSVVWWQNPGASGGLWIMHIIGNSGNFANGYESADYDHNGLLDVACGTLDSEAMIFFQTAPGVWQKVPLDVSTSLVGIDDGFASGDVDRDGNVDLVLRGSWLRNPGGLAARTAANWNLFLIGNYDASYKAVVTDLNGDGKTDIVFCSPHGTDSGTTDLVWFTPTTSDYTGAWTSHVIVPNLDRHTLEIGDINGDGTLDLFVSQLSSTDTKEVAIYYNVGGTGTNWVKQVVATTGMENGILADIGNDGDLDIIGSSYYVPYAPTLPLDLWINQLH